MLVKLKKWRTMLRNVYNLLLMVLNLFIGLLLDALILLSLDMVEINELTQLTLCRILLLLRMTFVSRCLYGVAM